MRIELPLAPSQNQLMRMHWRKRAKIQKDFAWLIAAAKSRSHTQKGKAGIIITRKSCGVEPDPDNKVASCKIILDALQDARVIIDDSPKHITLTVKWERAKKRAEQGTVVEIEFARHEV